MRNLNLLALTTTMALTFSQATLASQETVNALDSVQLKKSATQNSYQEVIVKWKSQSIANSLLRTPETARIDLNKTISESKKSQMKQNLNVQSQDRAIGLEALNTIHNQTGILLKHWRSSGNKRDLLKVNTANLEFSSIKKQLMETGLFEYVVENKTFKHGFGKLDHAQSNSAVQNKSAQSKTIDVNDFNDPFYYKQPYFAEPSNITKGFSSIKKARDEYINNKNLGRKLRVAIIDTGKWDHEDVEWSEEGVDMVSISGYYDCATEDLTDSGNDLTCAPEDATETSRDSNPKDKTWKENDDPLADLEVCISGHGLMVASSFALKTNNNKGGVGMVDADDIELINVRALGCEYGNVFDIIDAIEWASGKTIAGVESISTPVDMINISSVNFSRIGCNSLTPMNDALNYAREIGISVFVGAGNGSNNTEVFSPASCDNVINVGANLDRGELTDFSSFGDKIDMTTIGKGVYVAVINDFMYDNSTDGHSACVDTVDYHTCYTNANGTSFSSPLALGMGAMLKITHPELTPADIEAILTNTAVPYTTLPNGGDSRAFLLGSGGGVANVYNAMQSLDNLTNLEISQAKHHFEGFNTPAQAVYVDEMLKIAPQACDAYNLTWGYFSEAKTGLEYKLFNNDGTETMTENNSTLILETSNPYTVLDMRTHSRIGVMACENGVCGEVFELDFSGADKPVVCT